MRRNLTGTYKMEPRAPKVPSRYLRGSTGSCHDHCKPGTKQTTETKPINRFPKRGPAAPADGNHVDAANSVQRTKKVPSAIPKHTTRDFKKNNNTVSKDVVLKRQVLTSSSKKDVAIEPKSRDLKPKSENSQAKTCYLPSSRTPRRRHSEIILTDKDMSLTSSRIPKRRLSEIVVHPNRDVGLVLNMPLVGGLSSSKNKSRKYSKLSSVNKKSNSVNTVSSLEKGAKLPTLRSHNSLPKPELKGSRKSKPAKPIEEVVPEKRLYVIDCEETSKSKSPISPASSSSSGEKVMGYGHNVLQVCSPSPLMEDDTHVTDGQNDDNAADSGVKNTERAMRVGKLAVETRDCFPMKPQFRRGKVTSPRSESSSPRKLQFRQGKVLDKNLGKADGNKGLRRLASDGVVHCPESQSVSVVLKHQDMEEKKDSPGHSVSVMLKHQDMEEKQDPSSHSVSITLKHQDMEEKKDPLGLINNVIEETASKLIQTRKSKVKALVGAFENIFSSGNDTKTLDN